MKKKDMTTANTITGNPPTTVNPKPVIKPGPKKPKK